MRTAGSIECAPRVASVYALGLVQVVSAGLVGCSVGPSAQTFRPATRPEGVRIHLSVAEGRVSGELLEVTDESVLVLLDSGSPSPPTGGPARVVRYPIVSILFASLDQGGRVRPGLAQDRERMRLISRFPQGVDPELERRLLEAYGQTGAGRIGPLSRSGDELEAFLAEVRVSAARYSDPDRAIADGFVAVGPDAPAMGRHWIHPSRLLADVDPSRPGVLAYVEVDGERVLAGAGFAVAAPSGRVPAVPGVPEGRWHLHSGNLEAEGHRFDHEAEAGPMHRAAAVAVLHVWVPIENPAGTFSPDNWSLPYVRLGLRPDPDAPIATAKALSLLADGRAFFERQWSLSRGAGVDGGARRELDEALDALESQVRTWWNGRDAGPRLSAESREWLASLWGRLARFGL